MPIWSMTSSRRWKSNAPGAEVPFVNQTDSFVIAAASAVRFGA